MSWFERDKKKHRFYLLPGMGGSALRRKQRVILRWTLLVGVIVATVFGLCLYWLGKG